jgi:putative copper export protein
LVVLNGLAGWLLLTALTVLIGAVVMRWLMLPQAALAPTTNERLQRHSAMLGALAGVGFLAGLGAVLVRQTIEFRDPFVPLTADLRLLLGGTDWGVSWISGAALAVLATYGFARARRGSTSGWWIATAAVVPLGSFPGSMGHAAAAQDTYALARAADTVHVLAAGAWVGGLIMILASMALPAKPTGHRDEMLGALVPAFSPVALTAATLLVVSGAYASWMHLPDVASLWATSYGRVLLVKLAIVAAVALAGAFNWRRLGPRLGEREAASSLRRVAALEAALMQAALIATALLVRMAPPV